MSITIGGKTPETIFINQKEVMNISIDNDIVWGNSEYNLNYMWLKNTADSVGTLTLTKTGTPNATELYYSFDKVSWTAFDLTQASSTVSIPAGKTIYFRGNNTNGFNVDSSNNFNITMNTSNTVGGDIRSLVSATGFENVTTMPEGCYARLFRYNLYLTDASKLEINYSAVTRGGFVGTFDNCRNMAKGPDFNSVTIAYEGGFNTTFTGCNSLNVAPKFDNLKELSGDAVMYGTFSHCTSLVSADLSSITNVGTGSNVVRETFNNCSSLNYVKCPNIPTWNTGKFNKWLNGVAATGTVVKPSDLTIPTDNVSGIPTGWTTEDYHTWLSFTDVSGSANTLTLTKNNNAPTVSLEYSTDKTNWTTWVEESGVRTLTIPANGTVWLRGNNPNGFAVDNNNYYKFSSSYNIEGGGDLMSIINKNGADEIPAYGFCNLFYQMTTLKETPAINAKIYNSYCCRTMFYGCHGLTDTSNFKIMNPIFPTGSSYQFFGMFLGSRGLTSTNVFNGSIVNCSTESTYNQMFAYCSALTAVPEFTIDSNCKSSAFLGMFQSCTALTDISGINFTSTVIKNGMFMNTFKGCTSLTTGLDIRNATTVEYRGLNSTYDGCTLLSTAYGPTITWDATNISPNWLNNVAASGTLYADSSISSTIPTNDVSGCPTGWTIA